MTTRPKPPGTFRAPDACRLADITYRQLDYWARVGMVKPSLMNARGSGSLRLYSFNDVMRMRVISTLLDLGVGLGICQQGTEEISNYESFTDLYLVLLKGVATISYSNEVLNWIIGNQGTVVILPLEPIESELRDRIDASESVAV